MPHKMERNIFVSYIIAPELVSLSCIYYEQDTFDRQAMCYQAVPGFGMSTRETLNFN